MTTTQLLAVIVRNADGTVAFYSARALEAVPGRPDRVRIVPAGTGEPVEADRAAVAVRARKPGRPPFRGARTPERPPYGERVGG